MSISLMGDPLALPKVAVICLKWGTAYPAEHVNILYRAVADHMSLPFEFICITDDDSGLLPAINTHPFHFPIIPSADWIAGMWPKLQVFQRDLLSDYDVVLYLDLDLMITGPLAPLLEHCCYGGGLWMMSRGAHLWWRWLPERWQPKRGGNSSVLIFRPAEQDYLFETFNPTVDVERFGNDQNYIHGMGQDVRLLSQEIAVSFKHGCIPHWPVSWFKRSIPEPKTATFVVFHGKPKPADLADADVGHWGRKFQRGHGPVAWVQQYWQRYQSA